jgi:hypothetical protein
MPCCQTAKIIAQLVEAGHDDLADSFIDVLSGAWEELPDGWTEESVKKMWKSLTGDNKHKITKCMKAMKGKVSDPGAFCGSLAKKVGYDRSESGFRPRPSKAKQRAAWMRTYEDELKRLGHKPGTVDWDTATFFFSKGLDPKKAAQKYMSK